MADVKAFVDAKIAGKRVMVFSKTYCPYCTKAKDVLKKYLGKELPADQYEVLEIENRDDMSAIQDYLLKLTGARSVPRVFINGTCIGGGDETKTLDNRKELVSLITA